MTIFKMNSENLTHLCIQSDRYNMVMFQILQDQSSLSESYTVYRGGNKSQVLKDKWESLLHQEGRKGGSKKQPLHSEETACANLPNLANKIQRMLG